MSNQKKNIELVDNRLKPKQHYQISRASIQFYLRIKPTHKDVFFMGQETGMF